MGWRAVPMGMGMGMNMGMGEGFYFPSVIILRLLFIISSFENKV